MKTVLIPALAALTTFGTFAPAFGNAHSHEIAKFKPGKHLKEEMHRIHNHLIECELHFNLLTESNEKCHKEFHKFVRTLIYSYAKGEGFIEKDLHEIINAVKFAAEKHKDQTLKTRNIPYIIHPIGVARQLIKIGHVHDKDIIIAALLHGTVKNTETTFEEIEEIFGQRVADFVREVTNDKSLPKMERKRVQIEHAHSKSAGAAQIKLSDKIYNVLDLAKEIPDSGDQERAFQYGRWAQEVVDNLPWVNAPLKKAFYKAHKALKDKLQEQE